MKPSEFYIVVPVTDTQTQQAEDFMAVSTGSPLSACQDPTRVRAGRAQARATESGIYHRKSRAEDAAQRLAALNPTKTYAIMKAVAFFETGTPKVVSKIINDQGEYVNAQQDKPAR